MNNIKFSIVVPIYKVEKYIRNCVDSILSQTYSDLELILVDDGSPDGCPSICDEYAQSDSRVSVIHKENGGLISAWKAGVRKAQNEFLLFVDGDDWIEINLLQYFADILKNHCVDMIQFEFKKHYKSEASQDDSFQIMELKDIADKLIYYKGYQRIIFNNRVNKVFLTRKMQQLLDEIDERVNIGEDKQTVLCYVLNSKSILLSSYEGYYYRQNINSMTNSYSPEMYEKTEMLFGNMKRMIAKYSEFDFSEQLKKEKVIFAIGILSNIFRCRDKKVRRKEFEKIVCDPEIMEGAKIISDGDLSFFCRRIVHAIRKKSYCSVSFWQKVKKIKNKFDLVKIRIFHKDLH